MSNMGITRHIPNTITSLNLLSGCFATVYALNGNFKCAFLFIIAGAVFDFCDGLAARALKAYSPMGKELDSLADMVTFGVAPAMILYRFQAESGFLIYLPLFIAVFSGLRLAKFNIDTRQSENFIGLATPSCALICGSLIYAAETYPQLAGFLTAYSYIVPMLALILCYLLVCEIPMFSFKFKSLKWKDNQARFTFLGLVAILGIAILAAGLNWSLLVLAIFISYIVVNIITGIICRLSPKPGKC
ncbi:MAG: CDP-diacylglycerol--serine O-phosphatidyltransferase [Bacteroidales bacterium]|nr:CDP-diacylglycerol--serine O-phosphatidyltransferase [Bacteroidales bacterium]